MPEEEKLDLIAYYYAFEPTGVVEIDRILSAVARAGKGYHSTQDWADSIGKDGKTPVGRIQDAANAAAAVVLTVDTENAQADARVQRDALAERVGVMMAELAELRAYRENTTTASPPASPSGLFK